MKVVIQRALASSVEVDNKLINKIEKGMVILVGVNVFLIGTGIICVGTEAISVYENLGEIGVNVPFKQYFAKLKDSVDKE